MHVNSQDADSRAATASELRRLDRLANVLDTAIGIPGTRFRVGVDALIGLVPGVGDLVTAGVAVWIVQRGRRLGASRATVRRMLFNVALDLVVGTVPLAGDVFDAVWKANRRNVDLLLAELGTDSGPDAPGS